VTEVLFEVDADVAETAPLPWATERLRRAAGALPAGQQRVRLEVGTASADGPASDDPEAFRIEHAAGVTTIRAPHPRGLGYGLTELADRLENGGPAFDGDAEEHAPATPVRGVLRSFSSDVLDLEWFRDPGFWSGYLDELAVHRINRVQLAFGMQYNFSHDIAVRDNYLCFAYPFLLEVPGWDVEVAGVTDEDRRANLAALRLASEEAVRRGIDFQLGLWNHAVQPELDESPDLLYPITGIPDDRIAEYSAAALQQLLEACPAISGVTFRVHYEGGVPEVDHGIFWGRVMSGIAAVDRPIDIDMHAKGVDAELLDAAASAGERVALSPKYWAEHQGLPYHQARVRDNERARPMNGDSLSGVTNNTRRFTRYGYGDFLAADREQDVVFRIWPGTQRFLLWADPATFAGYGRWSTIGGSRGVELCEQLTFRGRKGTGEGPRDLYTDAALHRPASRDWEKYRYGYRLWGRLLYEPDADPSQWRRYLKRAYGDAAVAVEEALGAAGRILPLVTVAYGVSASNNYWWPEGYTNLPMYHPGGTQPYDFDTPAPYTWSAVSPFDPELFATTDEFVEDLLAGRTTAKLTAIDNAAALDDLVARTEAAVAAGSNAESGSALVREALVDARLLAGLGRMFAERVRAGIDVSLFDRTGEPAHLQRAREALQRSRDALAGVVDTAAGVYVDDLAFGDRTTERGAWRERVGQLDAELADIDARIARLGAADPSRLVALPEPRPASRASATSADDYVPGAEVTVEVVGAAPSSTVELHHRPLDQSAEWSIVTGEADAAGGARLVIPGSATASRYPLTWYVIADDGRGPRIVPGLGDDLCGRPYAVLSRRA
jgi:hypothetical protein